MAGSSLSSSSFSSSSASVSSFEDLAVKVTGNTIKFLCSHGGRILPRYPDGKLRYVGGQTRVLSVTRSVPYSELQAKLGELCGWGSMVILRCQLPNEDLDALVSITSDEDLANLIEEYEIVADRNDDKLLPLKIRAFLHPRTPRSPPIRGRAAAEGKFSARPPLIPSSADRCIHQSSGDPRFRGHHVSPPAHGSPSPQQYLIHHGNHWQ